MAKNKSLAAAQKAYKKGKKARDQAKKKGVVTTQPKQKKAKSQPKASQPKASKPKTYTPQVAKPKASTATKPKTVTPSVPSTNVTNQYQDYQKSKYAPKITDTTKKKPSTLSAAQDAWDRSQKAQAKAKKKGVVTTQAKKPKDNIISDFSKPKNYDYGKDLQKAAKKGSNKTYLGTDQEKVTVDLATKEQRKKQTEKQQQQFYKSDDWKETKAQLKKANRKQWREYLRDELGWSKDRINEWMESDEGKQYRKDTYTEMKDSVKSDINKSIKKGVDDATTLNSVNALTKGQFNKMVTASSLGKDLGNKYLQSVGGKKLKETIGSKTIEAGLRSKGAYGFMQAMSRADVFSGSVGSYNEAARTGMQQIKDSGAYNVGYGVGMALDMGMGGVASRGASLAAGTGKLASNVAGKLTGKGVTKAVAKEAAEEYAKLTKSGVLKRFGANRAGELAAETPTNILDAAKMSLDADGNLDKDEFKKWMIFNSAMTFGVGGAMEGVGGLASKRLADKTIELYGKKEAGNITQEELEKLEANMQKLGRKAKADTVSGDVASATKQNIEKRSVQAKKVRAEELNAESYAPGRKQGVRKGKYTYDAAQARGKHAKKLKADQENVAKRARQMAEEQARNPEKAVNASEIEGRKLAAETHSKGAKGIAEDTRVKEVARLRDDVSKLQERLTDAEKRAKSSGTLEGHARAVAEVEEINKALKIRKSQLKNAEGNTLSGRYGKSAKDLKKSNTLQGHEQAARRHERLEAEMKADSERKVAKKRRLEEAAKKAEAKAKAGPTPENKARADVAKEALEKVKAESKSSTAKAFEDAHIDKYIQEMSPKDIADRIKYLEDNLPKAKADRDNALKEHRRGFTEKGYRSNHYHTSKTYNIMKERYLEMSAELEQLKQARGILEESGADFKALEKAKANAPTKAKPNDRIEEINNELSAIHEKQKASKDAAEIRELNQKAKSLNAEKADLLRNQNEPKNAEKKYAATDDTDEELFGKANDAPAKGEPKPPNISKENAYSDFLAHTKSETPRTEKPKSKEAKKKVDKQTGGFKSFWRSFYNSFVSELAPYERMAMNAAKREDRKAGRVAINKMLTARAKALQKIRSEGDAIFTSRGLEKDAKKAEAYDNYALLMHDLDRLKQKMISVRNTRGTKVDIDFGKRTYTIHEANGNRTISLDVAKKNGYIQVDGKWNFDDMSTQDILDFCKKNDMDIDGKIRDKSYSGLTKEQIGDVLADLKKQYGKDIEDFQSELTNYHKDLLKMDCDAGIISKEMYEDLSKRYPNYVPAYRDKDIDQIVKDLPQEDINVGRLYEAKGSENMEGILPLYTQMVAKTNMVTKRAAQNEMLNVISKINDIPVEQLPKNATPEELLEVTSGVYKTQTGQHRIFFKQDGVGKSMEISEEAYHAMRQWSGVERAAIMEYKLFAKTLGNPKLQKAAGLFKAYITDYSIIFGARNFVRDTATALVYSERPTQWLRAFPKACMALLPEKVLKTFPGKWGENALRYKRAFEQYIKDGGRYSTLVTSTDLNKVIKAGKKEGVPGLRIIKEFNTAMETLPRMSEYIASVERLAKKEGCSFDEALKKSKITDEAMYNAKEVTLNFDRAGQYGRILNSGAVPFFNPSIQGIDKLVRVLYSDNKSMREFMEMGAKMATMVAMPAAAWELVVGQNEDYQKLSSYNKYTYFCIPWGKNDEGDPIFIKIPRAREMAAMQIPIDWFMQNVKYGTRDGEANLFMSAKRALTLGVEQIGPVNPLTDNFISPLINLARNKDWMGYNVEGTEDKDRRKLGNVNDIYDSDTSTAAVTIQHMINNGMTKGLKALGIGDDTIKWVKKHQMSPKQLDQIFDSYMGVLYDMGLRPFSQRGASLKEVSNNPSESVKQWVSSTFGTAFVVNGTLSSSRRTEVYAKLDNLYSKLDGYKKGTDEYNEVQSQITKLKNNVTYDMATLDSAIDTINRNKNLTQKEKAELTSAIKREQNGIIDDFNSGKNTVHDPLEYLINMKDKNGKKVFTTDQVIKKFTYTNDDGDNTIKDSWNYMKESDYYKKHPKKAEREFLALTLETRKIAGKCNESKSFMDYTTMAVVSESHKAETGKGYQHILDAYGVGSGQVKMADIYVNQMGGNTKTYTASHRHIVEGAEALGVYTSKLKDHDYAMILANSRTKNGNKLKDRAYFIEDINSWGSSSYAYQRMNPARCLSDEKYEKSNWTYKKVHKFAKANKLSYKSNDETIVNAIEKKYPNKSREEKAALFAVIKPTDDNPYGKIGDYSVKGDSGYDPNSGKGGRGRRGWGRRGHGGGGGGGGKSSFTPVVNTAGKNAKITNTSKKNHTSKSNLDDAYRKKLKKLREQQRKN